VRSLAALALAQAVIVSVLMRPHQEHVCAGVGDSFRRTVDLPSPIGRRAVIDGGGAGSEETAIRYPALDLGIQHDLVRRVVGAEVETDCRETPPDALQMEYETDDRKPPTIARAASVYVPRVARRTAYRRCLKGIASRGR
jgi:hypothetical protein